MINFVDHVKQQTGLEHRYSICLGAGHHVGWDTHTGCVKEAEWAYYDIQEALGEIGLTLTDVCIEHDFISGVVGELE